MIPLIALAATGIVAYGLGCYLNAVRQGRGAEWRRAFRRALRS